jgi:cytoskeletal protein RodZ
LLPLTWLVATTAAVALAWFAVTSAIADTSEQVLPVFTARPASVGPASSTVRDTAPPQTEVEPATDDSADAASAAQASTPAATQVPGTVDEETSPSNPQPPPTTAAGQTATFSSRGGIVTASCSGHAISLVSASPQPGYTVQVKNRGPEDLEVKFNGENDSEIKAKCVGGRPRQED